MGIEEDKIEAMKNIEGLKDAQKKFEESQKTLEQKVTELRAKVDLNENKSDPIVIEQTQKLTKSVSDALKDNTELRKQVEAFEKRNSDIEKRFDELETKLNRPGFDAGDSNSKEAMELREAESFFKIVSNIANEESASWSDFDEGFKEFRALSSYPSGKDKYGKFIPIKWDKTIHRELLTISVMRKYASVMSINTDTQGQTGATDPEVYWGYKVPPISDMSFDEQLITVYPLSGRSILSVDLLADSTVNIMDQLAIGFARKIDIAEEEAFTTGGIDNVQMPTGFMTNSEATSNFQVSGDATQVLTFDGLKRVLGGLPKQHKKGAVWMMNSDTETELSLIKDADGHYIWEHPTGIIAGTPRALWGIEIANNEFMPNIGANTLPVVYANFKEGYRILDRKGMTSQVLTEKYLEEGGIGMVVRKRVGGGVLKPSAYMFLKVAA